jgi:hypothetical protein
MKACPRCGVEFEESLVVCPLCKYTETGNQEGPPETYEFGKPGERAFLDYAKLTRQQKRKLFWEVSVIVLVSGILVTMVIDLMNTRNITWSKYTITVCLVLFANITLFSFLRHRLFILLFGSFITTSLLMVMLDVFNGSMGWATRLGIPLLFSLYVIIYFMALLMRHAPQHGFNILGSFFLAAGLYTLCIEAIVSYYVQNAVHLQWSLIVMVCMIPIAAVLFYFHYRLNKGAELKRFFHI